MVLKTRVAVSGYPGSSGSRRSIDYRASLYYSMHPDWSNDCPGSEAKGGKRLTNAENEIQITCGSLTSSPFPPTYQAQSFLSTTVHALHSLSALDKCCQNHHRRLYSLCEVDYLSRICSTCPRHTSFQERRHPPRSSERSHWPRRQDHVLTPYEPSPPVSPGGSHRSGSCILSLRTNRIASQPTSLSPLEIPIFQTPQ